MIAKSRNLCIAGASIPRHVCFSFGIFCTFWLILVIAGHSAMFRDPGTFWHVVVGENILSSYQLPHADTFSFTRQGQPWISDYWVAEIIMAAVHRAAGWDGLLAVSAAVLAGTFTFIAVRLLRAGMHWLLAGAILAIVFMGGSHQFHVRPLILTLAGLAAAFSLLIDIESGRKPLRSCWLLVPLFILWANMHGGVLAGLGCAALCAMGWILLWAAGRNSPIKSPRHAIEMLLFIFVICSCPPVNPYGLNLIRSWLETLSMPLPGLIEEHAPMDLSAPASWAAILICAIYAIAFFSSLARGAGAGLPSSAENTGGQATRGTRRGVRITWLMPLVLFALAVLRIRNAPLFSIAAALALADVIRYSSAANWLISHGWLSDCRESPFVEKSPVSSIMRFPLAPVLPTAFVALVLLVQAAGIPLPVLGKGWARFDPAVWPVDLLPELRKINDIAPASGGRIFNDLKFGGFLIYHAPRLKVFIDDRCTLYGSEFLINYDSARRGDPGQIDRWRNIYGFDHALVECGGPFDLLLQHKSQWALLGRSRTAALYEFNLGIFNEMK